MGNQWDSRMYILHAKLTLHVLLVFLSEMANYDLASARKRICPLPSATGTSISKNLFFQE